MKEGICCGTCRYHRFNKGYGDWECQNEDSDNYLDFTGYDDGFLCDAYEEREKSEKRLSGNVEKAIKRLKGV